MNRYTKASKLYTVYLDLCTVLCADVCRDHIKAYVRSQLRELHTRGVSEFVMLGKKHYNIAVRTAMRQDFEPIPFRKSDKDGFPKVLNPLKKYLLSEDPKQIRAVLTLLRAVYHFELKPKPQVTSITKPSGIVVEELPWFEDFVEFVYETWANPFKIPLPPWSTGDLHVTTKAGPSGLALISAVNDLIALVSDKDLFYNIQKFLMISQQKGLLNYMKVIFRTNQDNSIVPSKTLSKLAFLPEGGGKTRTIAIADYWSQCALKNLHQGLMRILKRMQTDGTYFQGRLASVMLAKTLKGGPIYCFDLTTATDRFPVVLQQVAIGALTSDELALYWRKLLCGRGFSVKDSQVFYSVGQPMGMLSSWPAFAVTHHAFVEFCAFSVGIYPFRDYVVLGDDVAIFNTKVAKQYRNLLESLEVPISKDKSIISVGGTHSCGEIAKRLFINGKEISPIPPDIIVSARGNKYLFASLVREYFIRSGDCCLQPWAHLAQRWFRGNSTFELELSLTIPPGYPGSLYDDLESWKSQSASLERGWYRTYLLDPDAVARQYRLERITSLEDKLNRTMRQTFKYLGKEIDVGDESHYTVDFQELFRKRIAKLGVGIPDSLKKMGNIPLLIVTSHYIQNLFDLRDKIYDGEITGDLDEKEFIPDVFAVKYFRTKQQYRRLFSNSLTSKVFKSLNKTL